MVTVVYNGPDDPGILHITAEPLVFPKGQPVEVHENVWASLQTLADNQGAVYGYWRLYRAPEPEPEPDAPPADEDADPTTPADEAGVSVEPEAPKPAKKPAKRAKKKE